MSDQRMENIFKQRLRDGALLVPDGMWQSIEPHLPSAQRRNRRGLIWIIGAGAVIFALVLIWMNLSSGKASITISGSTSTSNSTHALGTISTSTSNATHAIGTIDVKSSSVSSGNKDEAQSGLTVTPNQITTPESNPSQVPLSNTNNFDAQRSLVGVSSSNTPLALSASGDGSLTLMQSTSTENLSETGITQRRNSQRLAIPFIMLAVDENRKLPDPAKDCYSFGRKGSGGNQGVLFGEAYIGPTFASRKLTSRNEDVSSYITQRDSTETSRLSWHGGLRLGYLHRSGLTLRIGGHYSVVNELFDYFDGSTTGTVIRMDTIRDGNGNIISINTDTVTVTGQRIKTTHNRYHTLDIPVLLGYQVMQNHWTYGIQAGPVFNAAFTKKGDILDPSGTPATITDNKTGEYPAFRDKLGLSIYVAAHIGKRIGYRTIVYAEPYLHRRLHSLTLDSYPIDQRQTNVGLSLGLRVIFK